MSVSILEALISAQYNLNNLPKVGMGLLPIIKEQLGNSITLLDKGYGIHEHVEPLLEKYGNADSVPEKDEEK